MKTDVENQIALVTGASSGIGKAIALRLASQAINLCLVGRNLAKLEIVADSARKTAREVACYQIDLAQDGEIRELKAKIEHNFDHFDFLIHSAGLFIPGPLETAPVEDLDKQYRINLRAPYYLTQVMLPLLKVCRGQIVFVNSSVSLTNVKANLSQYCATKLALKALADSLRNEVNAYGIRVLSIFPGRTASPMQAAIFNNDRKEYQPDLLLQPEDIAEAVITALRMPRTAEITDINIRPFIKPF